MSKVAGRVRAHRDALRAAELKPLQIWVPDTRRPGFAEECARQSALLREDPRESEVLAWLEAVADTERWKQCDAAISRLGNCDGRPSWKLRSPPPLQIEASRP